MPSSAALTETTPEPIEAPRRERVPFPLDAFPEWLGVFVADVAAAHQVPLDMVAGYALGTLAIAGARVADVRTIDAHVEPLCLFVGIIAEPGSRKSAIVGSFLKVVNAMESELIAAARPEVRAARLERERLEHELARAKKGRHWASAEIADLTEQLENAADAIEPRLTASDATAQQLVTLLCRHRCLAIAAAEPVAFQTMLGRWSGGKGSTELDAFLCGHAGDTLKVDRVGRPPEKVENPRLSLAIGLQPQALKSLSGDEVVRRGLPARFLWVFGEDVRGQIRVGAARAMPEEHAADFDAGLRRVFGMSPRSTTLNFGAEAQALWRHFADRFELRLAPGGDMRDLFGWGEKYRGLVARIAGLLHLAGDEPFSEVSRATLEAAIAIGEWAEWHALEAFSVMELRQDVRDANNILEVVRRNEWSTFSRRDLHQRMRDRHGYTKTRDLETGLALLVARGALSLIEQRSTGKHGRPASPQYAVSPRVHAGEVDL